MKVIKSLLIIVSIVGFNFAYGQNTNTTCPDMDGICTDSLLIFPINANAGTAPAGNDYGCLGTQPNPSWFYFEVSQSGDINMELTSTNDMDYVIWGPFADLATAQGACGNLGMAPNPLGNVDCGFLGGNIEYPTITGAVAGEVYVMLITNFSNVATTFSLEQIGGTGGTDCSVVVPACLSDPGTFTLTKNGLPTTSPIQLCGGDSYSILSNADYSLPEDTISTINGGDGIYTAQLMFLVYDMQPSGNDPSVDPGYTGFILPTDTIIDINDATSPVLPLIGGCGTYWLVPVAGDDGIGANGNVPGINDNGLLNYDLDGNGCYLLGTPIEVVYACDVVATPAVNCTNGNNIDITLSGGSGGNVDLLSLGAGTLSATSTIPPDVVTLSGLSNGAGYNVSITDVASGCQQTVSGTFSTPQFVNVTVLPAASCASSATGSIFVEADPGSGNGGLVEILIDGVSETTTIPFDTSTTVTAGSLVDIILVDQAGCTTDSSVTIGSSDHSIVIDVIALGTVSCNGSNDGSATVNAYAVDGNGNPTGVTIVSITWTDPFGNTYTGAAQGNMMAGTWTVTAEDVNGCETTIPVTITSPATLTLVVQSFGHPNCYGESNGSINLGIVGGTPGPGVTFNWLHDPNLNSQTANSLPAGTYSCEVIDENDCISSITQVLEDPDPIDATFIVGHVNCYGDSTGKVTIADVFNYQGPQSGLFYAWDLPGLPDHELNVGNNGQPILDSEWALDLPAGDYSVIIGDDAGCTNSFDFTVTQNPELLDSTGTIPAFCRIADYQSGNGVVYSSGFGGAGNWTYLWENDETGETVTTTSWAGLNPGSYTITITDNADCELIRTIVLDSVSPVAQFTPISDQFTGPGEFEGTEVMDVEFINESMYFSDPLYPESDTTFQWTFDAGDSTVGWFFSFDYDEKIENEFDGEHKYEVCLIAKNYNDCTDTICKIITSHSIPVLNVPNVFTPGAAPNNEFYFPSKGMKEFDCSIFNRYGVEVYHFTSIEDRWDGSRMNDGKPCSDGVYFFNYTGTSTNNTEFKGQGFVHLIRAVK